MAANETTAVRNLGFIEHLLREIDAWTRKELYPRRHDLMPSMIGKRKKQGSLAGASLFPPEAVDWLLLAKKRRPHPCALKVSANRGREDTTGGNERRPSPE
jgi:hypothetical protein